MAHVPKRAVQHSIYTPQAEVSAPCLKPGQVELNRFGLYSEISDGMDTSREAPRLLEDSQLSEYRARLCHLKTEDFQQRPKKQERQTSDKLSSAAHWCSEYRVGSQLKTKAVTAREILTPRQTARCCVSRLQDFTSNDLDYGRKAFTPRDNVSDVSPLKSDLAAGSTIGTSHIPGYQGFIPRCVGPSEKLRKASTGVEARSVDKTNIVHTFHKDIVGYAGHIPQAVRNDFGGRKPTDLTTFGHDFKSHKIGMLG